MTAPIVDGWNLLGDRLHANDAQVFERLTVVACTRWPCIRRGFAGFDLETVAAWPTKRSRS